ncbi:MAG: pentapeptide repeat-containing protein [Campylobacteraceae bacterium]|nr:pentapeptide repeat-containing protein [Campylobacteraceae bacterium]
MSEKKINKCKIEDCGRDIDEKEYLLTKDENRCILHCNKSDSFSIEINSLFIDELNKLMDYQIRDNIDQQKEIEQDETFTFNVPWGLDFYNIHFPIMKIALFFFDNMRKYDLYFENCVFCEEQKKVMYDFKNRINFINCIFKENVDFSNSTFSKNISFEKSTFEKKLILEETTFDGNVNFKEVIFKEKVKIDSTYFNGNSNFIYLNKNYKKEVLVENRETARIIKDSFEQQNNIIEANKFYALEMKEREKELNWKKDFFDWIVFKAHGLASNHSQNWLLPIFWIIFLGLLNSYFQPLDFYTMNHSDILYKEIFIGLLISLTTFVFLLSLIEHKIYYNYISSFFIILLVYLIFTNDIYFSDFANSVNPFSIMTKGEELSFGTLIYKIIIAYLIYQLIISIRQNTRRK